MPHVTIVGIYRSPKIPLQHLLEALSQLLISLSSHFNIFIGDFNINWFDAIIRRPLYNFFINDNNYRQLVISFTTDNQTLIDHIYTNLPKSEASSHILETYFSFCYPPISQKRLHFDIISIHFVHILIVRHQI